MRGFGLSRRFPFFFDVSPNRLIIGVRPLQKAYWCLEQLAANDLAMRGHIPENLRPQIFVASYVYWNMHHLDS